MERFLEVLEFGAWMVPWGLGGGFLVSSVFRVGRAERDVIGLGVGLVIQIWLANLFSHVVSIPLSFWIASVVVLAVGLAAASQGPGGVQFGFRPLSWIILVLLAVFFSAIGRGLAIFDDYQNLPTLSLMAAGDVPPHFALDPSLRFGYHYFLLLLGAEFMRLGTMLPWTSLDLARGFVLAVPLVLAALWAHRITRSWLAAFLSAAVVAFSGGARWLFLLMPTQLVDAVSSEITLIGSSSASASNLAEALVSEWKIDGGGPIPFPFAFHSGVNPPYVMAQTGIAGSGILVLLLLLLTAERWRNWGAAAISGILLASLALANEIAFLLLGLGLVIVCAWAFATGVGRANRQRLVTWLGVMLAALAVAFLQGGMVTELARATFGAGPAANSYFDPTPLLTWPPSVVSAHLGALSLVTPAGLLAAALEVGPVVLISPLLMAWGRRALRRGRWLEASVIASSAGAVIAIFVSFKGPLFTAAPRLMSGWVFAATLYFVPLIWHWLAGKPEPVRVGGLVLGGVACLSGVVLLAVQLVAMQRPVFSTFITPMDAKMSDELWNELPPEALVFDPLVYRAPTVLGRATRSSPSWYTTSPEWEALRATGEPYKLREAGFDYMYIDGGYVESLSTSQREALDAACVKPVLQVDGFRSESDYRKDFRRLIDIRGCT